MSEGEAPTLHANQGYQESPDQPPYLVDVKHGRTPTTTAIQNFSPVWYVIAMDTGILGILLDRLQYQFHGIQTLATICYVILIILMVVFSLLQVVRLAMFPKAVFRQTSRNLEEITYWSNALIAWETMAALTATQVSTTYWGGNFKLVAYVLWWIGAAGAVLNAAGVCLALFRLGLAHDRTLPPSIFLPLIALLTTASTGGIIVNYGFDVSARLAMPIIIFSYFLVGYGVFVSILMYSIFTHRLMAGGMPAPAKLPGLFILIGPMGQAAAALQLLGTAALSKQDFLHYNKGTFLTGSAASSVDGAGVLIALLFLGFDYFWCLIAVFAVVEAAFKKELSYSMMWWSTIFPLGTLCTAWEVLGVEMDSPTFRTLSAGLLIILWIIYFVNCGFTIFHLAKGTLISKSSREEVEEMEKKQREGDEEKQD
jgi:tellurite resistance protein TehA-like permease